MISKLSTTKDVIQIIRDILMISGTLWAFWKAPPIINQKEIALKNNVTNSIEQLRSLRFNSLQKQTNDIIQIDDQMKDVLGKDEPMWLQLKAVRDLKEKEIIRLENEIKK